MNGHERARGALVMDAVEVSYGSVKVLAGVSLAVPGGSLVGLVGPNGAGKTTLLDVACGLAPQRSGRVTLGGVDITRWPAHRRARLGLGRVFQSLDLFDDLDVAEHVAVAAGPAGRGALNRPGGRSGGGAPCLAWVGERTGVGALPARARPSELSHPQRKALGLARAVATVAPAWPAGPAGPGEGAGGGVVVVDEPFAGLDSEHRVAMADALGALARGGMGVLVADHDLGLLAEVCDSLVVLAGGRVVAAGAPLDVLARAEVVAAFGAPPPAPSSPREPRPSGGADGEDAAVVLRVEGLGAGHGGARVLVGVDLVVDAGEVVAVLGPDGVGKSTLVDVIAGLLPPTSGAVEVLGARLPHPPERLARRGLAVVPHDRAVVGSLTVAENLRLPRGAARRGGPDPVKVAVGNLASLAPLLGRRASALSGGEQHLLAVGRALAASPRLIVVDEVSTGLSASATGAVLAALGRAARSGAGVVLVDGHGGAALDMADRALLLGHSGVVWTGPAPELARRPDLIEAAYAGRSSRWP